MEYVFLRIAFAETDEQFESTIGKYIWVEVFGYTVRGPIKLP